MIDIEKLLERAINTYTPILEEGREHNAGFMEGIKCVLENPGDWLLVDITKVTNTHQQLEKCKEALKRVLQSLQARSKTTPGLGAPINIIKTTLIEIEEL